MNSQALMKQYSLSEKYQSFFKGVLATLPLTVAVIPWGILAGSIAIESGLDMLQSQAMSAIVFAGAAQLAALGMIKAGLGLGSVILTTILVTSRHLLYSMAMREKISPLSWPWRVSLGFLLTDELFAIANRGDSHKFDRWYALGGGLSFYISWNIASLVGIIAGHSIPQMQTWGLDFAIAATFIALVVPLVKKASVLICVLVSLTCTVLCELMVIGGGLVISALLGMSCGYLYDKKYGKKLNPGETS